MRIGVKATIGSIVGVMAMAGAAYLWFGNNRAHEAPTPAALSGSGPQCCSPGSTERMTLDPKLFNGDVRKAYVVAEQDPALLAQLHCYCGCDKQEGHKNLLDCFRDKHGSTCAICVGEAVEAEVLAQQGMPIEQIRDTLRDKFAHGE